MAGNDNIIGHLKWLNRDSLKGSKPNIERNTVEIEKDLSKATENGKGSPPRTRKEKTTIVKIEKINNDNFLLKAFELLDKKRKLKQGINKIL